MKLALFSLVLIISQISYSAQIINMGPDFEVFLETSNGLDPEGALHQWEMFESKYKTIFDEAIYRTTEENWEERREKKRKEFFFKLPQLKDKMSKMFSEATEIVTQQEALFRSHFPDLPATFYVVFMPSLFSFNGQVREISGFPSDPVLIGVDMTIERGDSLNVLFSHEFFHAYHDWKLANKRIGQTMASPLWIEGFATYASGLLNPRASDEELLLDGELAKACKDPQAVAEMAKLYLEILDSTGPYKDWFLMNGTTKPVRRGYCLGLQVIRKVALKSDLTQMIAWDEKEFSVAIRKALESF
ncbi:MAG: hypothetical protein AB7O96_17410 [Pseudobdellovibrionaceae bacterium]